MLITQARRVSYIKRVAFPFVALLLLLHANVPGGTRTGHYVKKESPQVDNSLPSFSPPDRKPCRRNCSPPPFNSDSAYYFIQKQLDFGPRVPGLKGHTECARYIETKLKEYGATTYVQHFTAETYHGKTLELMNIIGSFNPRAKKRILLGTHWDTRPYADKDSIMKEVPIPGANDGGSGTGILLEIARVLSENPLPRIGVDMIFFDGEDYGEPEGYVLERTIENAGKIWWCLGSQYWSKNMHDPNYKAKFGILLDMVGGKDARFYKEGGSMQFAKKYVNKVWKVAHKIGHGEYFVKKNVRGIMDDHIFVNRDAGIPMLNIIEYNPATKDFFPDYHHTHGDNINVIGKETLQAVGETVLYILYNE
jgi:glutaminyl-peptide cyclotransferase